MDLFLLVDLTTVRLRQLLCRGFYLLLFIIFIYYFNNIGQLWNYKLGAGLWKCGINYNQFG